MFCKIISFKITSQNFEGELQTRTRKTNTISFTHYLYCDYRDKFKLQKLSRFGLVLSKSHLNFRQTFSESLPINTMKRLILAYALENVEWFIFPTNYTLQIIWIYLQQRYLITGSNIKFGCLNTSVLIQMWRKLINLIIHLLKWMQYTMMEPLNFRLKKKVCSFYFYC